VAVFALSQDWGKHKIGKMNKQVTKGDQKQSKIPRVATSTDKTTESGITHFGKTYRP
jgi:hypothetical protein